MVVYFQIFTLLKPNSMFLQTNSQSSEKDFSLIPVVEIIQPKTEEETSIDYLFDQIRSAARKRFKHRAIHIDENNKIRNFFRNRLSGDSNSNSIFIYSVEKTTKIADVLAYCANNKNFALRFSPGDILQRIPGIIDTGKLDKRTNVKIVIYLKKISERDHYKLVLQHTPEHFSVSLVTTSGKCELDKGDGVLMLNKSEN